MTPLTSSATTHSNATSILAAGLALAVGQAALAVGGGSSYVLPYEAWDEAPDSFFAGSRFWDSLADMGACSWVHSEPRLVIRRDSGIKVLAEGNEIRAWGQAQVWDWCWMSCCDDPNSSPPNPGLVATASLDISFNLTRTYTETFGVEAGATVGFDVWAKAEVSSKWNASIGNAGQMSITHGSAASMPVPQCHLVWGRAFMDVIRQAHYVIEHSYELHATVAFADAYYQDGSPAGPCDNHVQTLVLSNSAYRASVLEGELWGDASIHTSLGGPVRCNSAQDVRHYGFPSVQ